MCVAYFSAGSVFLVQSILLSRLVFITHKSVRDPGIWNMLTLCTLTYLLISCTIASAAEIEIDPSNATASSITINMTEVNITAPEDNNADKSVELIIITTEASQIEKEGVPEDKPKCKANIEIHSKCANSCPASCEDLDRKPCRNYCWSGCECAPGYVRNHRWKCIPVEDCPKCSANEHYRNCGSNCEPNCDNYQNMLVACIARASCKRGCFCDFGFVRDLQRNGTCVPLEQCPQKCSDNEYWDPNGEPCTRTVENPRPSCLFHPLKPSCVCNTGFRRDAATNKCSPISKTAEFQCQTNETFSYCGSECALNCFDESKRAHCPTVCNRGCFCKPGFRRENSGRCVLPADCQVWMNPTELLRV